MKPTEQQIADLIAAGPRSNEPAEETARKVVELLGWRSIETAPKDGTEIIGLMGRKTIRLVWYFKASSATQDWLNENGKKASPTHWMPLPKLPE